MINLAEIKTDLLVKLGVSTTTAYYTDTILNGWIDQSYKWAAGYKKWPFTEGRVSTTFASLVTDEDSLLVGEYPEGWKSDSIRQLTIGGKLVDKKNYYKFRKYFEDNPSSNERIFTDYARRIYINPRIDLSGTVTAWGQFTPAIMDDAAGATDCIFSAEQEGLEAVTEKCASFARLRDNKFVEAQAHEEIAKKKLEDLYTKIKDEQFGYQDTDSDGMFERINVVTGTTDDDVTSNRFTH